MAFLANATDPAKKLGTLDQTLQSYRPAKLRDVMAPHLDALIADGYLLDYRWRKEGKGRASVRLKVTYVPDEARAAPAPLTEREAEAVSEIGRLLGEPANSLYHATVVRTLGAPVVCRIARDVAAHAERRPQTTHKGKLFSYLVRKERERTGRAAA